MNEEKLLAECRAHWEATKPEAVFADYWLGWKAARETIVVELPKPEMPEDYEIFEKDDPEEYARLEARGGAQYAMIFKCKRAIESSGARVKS